MPSRVETDELRNARAGFRQIVITCAALVVGCHVLDFAGVFTRDIPPQPLRRYCTIAYFTALIVLCVMMMRPRARYMQLLYAWRYEDSPPAIEKTWREFLFALDRAVTPCAVVGIAFLATTALKVLLEWHPSLVALRGIYEPGWWISALALLAIPFFLGDRLNEARQRHRLLREQLVTSTYKPRATAEIMVAGAGEPSTPVEIRGPQRFWAGGLEWGWDDFYKSCVVLGQPGSGKTVCVLNALLDGLLGSGSQTPGRECSALILDPKGDYRHKIVTLCRRYGRERDLLVITPRDPARSIRWNPFDSADSDLELAERLAGAMETLGMKSNDTSFWIDSAKKFIRHSVGLQRLSNPRGTPPDVTEASRLAGSFAAIAERSEIVDVADPACEVPLQFFAEEWTQLAPEPRTSVQAHISNMLDPFLSEPYRTLFTGRSTMRVGEMLDRGKILYVDMPIAEYPAMSRTIGTLLKLEYFNEVLRRLDNPRPSLFFCDEFQAFFTHGKSKGDADFFDKSRQSNHANIIATQNISGLLKQCRRPEHAETLLGLCQVKVFLRNTDHRTNDYASRLFGESIELIGGLSGQSGNGGVAGLRAAAMGQNALGQWGRNARPERFAELGIPSRVESVSHAESLIHLAARPEISAHPMKRRWRIHPLVNGTRTDED